MANGQLAIIESKAGSVKNAVNENIKTKNIPQKLSIDSLRLLDVVQVNKIYKTGGNTEGDWSFDPSDNMSPDNTGTIIVTHSNKRLKRIYQGAVNIEWFGARPGVDFDNGPAISKAINTGKSILIPPGKNYTVRSAIVLTSLKNRIITATGSTIINRNYDARTFLFIDCSNVVINGGKYTRDVLPTIQNGKAQSSIGFQNCKNVTVKNAHIDRSPEMGIDNNIVIGGTFSYNTIEHCLRDGIYAHYSANLKYIGNHLNQIKDDALSMHDYGLDNQKEMLHKAGYTQAGHSIISGNTIQNSVQGISTIGCTSVSITGNAISQTVHAGICIINSEDLYPNSTARVNNIIISNNTLKLCETSINVNGIYITPSAPLATGHSAIFIGCNKQGQAYTSSRMRLSQIKVLNNKISNSSLSGITLYNIDGVTFTGNVFYNCFSNTSNFGQSARAIAEIQNCTIIDVKSNQVTNTLKLKDNLFAYLVDNSSGQFVKGVVKGLITNNVITNNSKILDK